MLACQLDLSLSIIYRLVKTDPISNRLKAGVKYLVSTKRMTRLLQDKLSSFPISGERFAWCVDDDDDESNHVAVLRLTANSNKIMCMRYFSIKTNIQ